MSLDDDLSKITTAFFVEAGELLAEAEELLVQLNVDTPSDDLLNAIFRVAHSIKGGAASLGFVALTDTTHLMESLLDRARNHQIAITDRIVDVLLLARDALKEQLGAYEAGGEPDEEAVERTKEQLKDLLLAADAAGDGGSGAGARNDAAALVPQRRLKVSFSGLKPGQDALLFAEMGNLGRLLGTQGEGATVVAYVETNCTDADIVAVACFILEEEQVRVEAAPPDYVPAEGSAAAAAPAVQARGPAKAAAGAAAPAGRDASSLRVDVDKIDKLINLVGELVITQSMLLESSSVLDPVAHERLLSGLSHLERNARDLQESVMSIRMMPMDGVFARYPRIIRDTSAKLGKQARLVTYGKDTELDKGLIERIVDPLTHLVRNSLDHGIEMPEQRLAAGKDACGEVMLSAQHQGGNIVIEVSDDGAGLNRQKILAKARSQGLEVSDDMPDQQVWQLIFAPGFSTAEVVTDISGRGVGMDVVKRNIQEMGGHVQVESREGHGTTTRIFLPLTLAILDGMSVRVGREIYVLPLNNVLESLQPGDEHLHSVTGDRHVIRVREDYLPLIALREVFAVPGGKSDPRSGIAVILQNGSERFALLVDELLGQHQVVVKNLESHYRKVDGISAATILGDGSVALIVDIAAMSRLHAAFAAAAQPVAARAQAVLEIA